MTLLVLPTDLSTISVAGLVAAVTFAAFVYRGYQAAPNLPNGLPLPPGPPARWFWQNALPSVK